MFTLHDVSGGAEVMDATPPPPWLTLEGRIASLEAERAQSLAKARRIGVDLRLLRRDLLFWTSRYGTEQEKSELKSPP